MQGDHGKPHLALIVQSDHLETSSHVVVLLMTSMQVDAPLLRLPISATPRTGMTVASDVVLDRTTTAARDKIGAVIGHLDDAAMVAINRAMAAFLGLA